jgi:transglutaminase-like putative cysteine protease
MEKTPSTRWWDLPSAILLFLMIQVSTWRLQASDWTENLNLVRNIAVFGLVVGMALGQSIFKKRNVILLSFAYMLITFIWQWLGFIEFDRQQTYLGDKFLILFGRLFTSISEFVSGREVDDQILVLVLLSFPYWFISLYSGYQLTRYANVLAAILPSAGIMFIIHYYHYTAKDYSWIFGVFLFFTLLFIGRQKYLADKTKWTKERVLFSNESSLDINNTTFTVAASIVLLAWFIPYTFTAQTSAKETWQKISGDWFSSEFYENLFSSINKEKKPQAKNFQTELGLGTQTSQSDAIIFLVYTPPKAEEYPRLYWRGQVYDTYQDGTWFISSEDESRYSASRDIEIPDIENRSRLTFTFDIYTETQIVLFTPAQPISVNHNAIILHEKIPPNDVDLDVLTVRASPALEIGDLVRVSSMMANPIISDLRTASDDYPSWALNNYLQLPDNFSPEIKSLAQDITEPYNNAYDKTVAITNYLRRTIEYAPAITIPEDETDPLAYFLFDLQRGFCNYSASAEVLMLRSIGIPARLAVGYAQGEANLQNSIYTVRERDLHAWPEVYFPNYGWIEFEPTGNQEPLARPTERIEQTAALPLPANSVRQLPSEEEETTPLQNEANDEEQANVLARQMLIRRISILSGIILLMGVGIFIKRRYAPHQSVASILKKVLEKNKIRAPIWLSDFLAYASLPSIERNFHAINSGLRWLQKPQPLHSTPTERANVLKKILPVAESSIDILLGEYQNELFSKTRGNEKSASRAALWIRFYSIRARVKFLIMGYN